MTLTFPAPALGSLEHNLLGPDGGAAIAEGLKGNTSLQKLKCACHA